jgi:uncharacterized membrane protein YcaP (DUF421 family)
METILRVAAIYVFVMLSLRLMGKREFGQLSPFELVTLLLIPEIAAQSLVREDFSLTNAMVGLSTLFLLVFLTSLATHVSRRAEDIIGGEPSVLVSQGALVTEAMHRARITPGEIFGEMHKVGLHSLEQIRWAILENDGKISIIPARAEDRQVKPREEGVR